MTGNSTDFVNTVRYALKHYDDPARLEQNSPLVSPYFLGQYLEKNLVDGNLPYGRGKLLQRLLYDAAVELWGGELPADRDQLVECAEQWRAKKGNKGGVYHFYLLELRYFRKYFSSHTRPSKNSVVQIVNYLSIGTAPFHRHINAAINSLAEKLILSVQPTMRLEQPKPLGDTEMVGRRRLLSTIMGQLDNNQAVMVSGMGGMGKTTLGEMIYDKWEKTPAFWSTVRPYLNDDVNSLLFSLAHFLKQHGATTLWVQLMTKVGQDWTRLLGYLENDLRAVNPLLCFDEVDRLLSRDPGIAHPNQVAVLELFENLVGVTPMLLIGQHPIIDTHQHHKLTGLGAAEADQLLERIAPDIEPVVSSKWPQWTEGSPRLLHLCVTLHRNEETVRSEIDLSGPFQRLWRRLSPEEQGVLAELSVYLSPAPADVWSAEQAIVKTLIQRQIVKEDGNGGIEILPTWRLYLYHHFLLPESRLKYHEKAAVVRLQRGEYTVSAYHYALAGAEDEALDIWYRHSTSEIERGFMAMARHIFVDLVSPTKLEGELQKKQLTILRNDLFTATGGFDEILQTSELRPITNDDSIEDVIIDQQEARTEFFRGDASTAIERYEHALNRLAKMLKRDTMIRNHLGRIFLDEGQLSEAQQKADEIYTTYLRLKADIARRKGDFNLAEQGYLKALDYAESNNAVTASIHHGLMIVLSQQGKIELATYHAEEAKAYYIEIGNRVLQETIQMEIAGMYLQAEQFEKVIEYGEPALTFFRKVRHQTARFVLLNILAQAYFEIGNIEKAKEYANKVRLEESPGQYALACYTLGRIHLHNKKAGLAEAVFTEGFKVAVEQKDIYMQAYLLRERSKAYTLEGDMVQAKRDYDDALELFNQMGLDDEIDK